MKIYKVIPYSGNVVLNKGELPQTAILRHFDVIKQECVDGWEFHSALPVVVTKKIGGINISNITYNAFIFVKEVEE